MNIVLISLILFPSGKHLQLLDLLKPLVDELLS